MFDYFLKEKSDFLKKKDKSKKGHVDKDIIKIIEEINSKGNYYTTSSCSGRIVLLKKLSNKKSDYRWLLNKHDKVKLNEISNSLKKYDKNKQKRELPLKASKKEETNFGSNAKNQVWFKQQPIILHVACRNLDAAKKLLDASRKVFKHSGIIGITERKVTLEIIGSERLETIIADRNFIADENYVKNLVKYANRNFEENKKKSERVLKIIRKEL